jgi:hypothetical protein
MQENITAGYKIIVLENFKFWSPLKVTAKQIRSLSVLIPKLMVTSWSTHKLLVDVKAIICQN